MSIPERNCDFYKMSLNAILCTWKLSWGRVSQKALKGVREYNEIRESSSKSEQQNIDRIIKEIRNVQKMAFRHIKTLEANVKNLEEERTKSMEEESIKQWTVLDRFYASLYWKYIEWADQYNFSNEMEK